MKALSFLFRFYIHSSIHLSLALACLVLISYYYLNLSPDLSLVFFVFFGSVCGYNFIKYYDVLKRKEKAVPNALIIIAGFTILSFLFAVYFFTRLSFGTQLTALLCGILTFFYSFTFSSNGKNLRSIHGGKIFVIALVCTTVTLVLPVVQNDPSFDILYLLNFLQRFLFILVVVLPFEIRDVNKDSISLGTIPQKIGVQKTKILGMALLALFVCFSFWLYEGVWVNIWADISIAIIAALFLGFSKETQQEYYASFWVEAIPIFWLGIWMLLMRGF